MIKATELRIGNLLFYKDVDLISVTPQVIYDIATDVIKKEFYKPIPLSEELLKRFGFDVNRFGNYSRQGVSISKVDDGWRLQETQFKGAWRMRFEYLHQLQNLYLALTREELK